MFKNMRCFWQQNHDQFVSRSLIICTNWFENIPLLGTNEVKPALRAGFVISACLF